MKKRNLSLALLLMLIVSIFTLTGCGSKKSSTSSDSSSDSSDEIIEANGIAIDDIVEEFNGGVALVKDSEGNRYVINENGKVIYTVSDDLENDDIVLSNGYITIDGHYIYDSEGKEIINDTSRWYGAVSVSGYVAVSGYKSDISGSIPYSQVEDLKGNIISDVYSTGDDWIYMFEDFFGIYDRENSSGVSSGDNYHILLNAKNKKTQTLEDVVGNNDVGVEENAVKSKSGDWYYIDLDGHSITAEYYWVKSDFSKVICADLDPDFWGSAKAKYMVLNKYFVVEYSDEEDSVKLTDLEGNELKDFTDIGGVSNIVGYDDVIYVITTTGYIYTLDTTNFEYIAEPIKKDSTNGFGSFVGKVDKGVIALYKGSLCIIDENLQVVEKLENVQDMGNIESYGENFIYGYSYIYNTETDKILQIYIS